MCTRGDHSQRSPDQHHRRKEDSGWEVREGEVGRYLAEDVANGKDGVDLVELVALERELFLHAGHVGIEQVGAVEVVGQVREAGEGENEEVELEKEEAFAGGSGSAIVGSRLGVEGRDCGWRVVGFVNRKSVFFRG